MPRSVPTITPAREARRHLRLCLTAACAALGMASGHAQLNTSGPPPAVTPLAFSDFFRLPIGPAGLELSPRLQQADRQRVQLTGYMVQQESVTPGRFLLTQRPVQMSEHADGEADDLPPATVMVLLDQERGNWIVPHLRGPVRLQGELRVGRQEDPAGRVYWVSLQLSPESTRSMDLMELANHLHAQLHRH